ncbi:MAG: type 1 glutamine amidotransferase [Paracoccaceae bacterium]
MRVAIVENTRVTHHGQVGVALHEAAARIDLWKPWAGQPLPARPEADALVVFGGEQSARDDGTHPYLPHLADLMAEYTALDRPVLGICLGAQVLARAFGADNLLGAAPEFGWCQVRLTDEGRADPLMGRLPEAFPIYQWHSDTFTLPAGATRLAGSDRAAQQAFRIGRATYGTQFHFEASRAVVADWAREFPQVIEKASPGWLSRHGQEASAAGPAADAHGLQLARAWVGLI